MALSKLQLSQLLSTYGAMLTQKQREIVAMYCDCDCTLSEVASEQGISRQAVRDTVVKAEKTLTTLENELHIAQLARDLLVAVEEENYARVTQIAKKFVGKE
ncbi:MAG TPA: hypothetical protein IAC95_05535 [Candidatus Fimimonas gallinarum]|uniref:Uncharacterized protein n=1 Tax=Candidatus Fimimonas gallinarum TaxID=2840821 RepID=A0A9D1J8V8_9BACT|nr:hypothetical protein [Candidatus Fimimonas gallinarum]